MSSLVIYESLFGNTAQVAQRVAESLGVEATPVADAPTELPEEVSLLVVGAPTHVLGLSSENTRKSAAENGAPEMHTGVREWAATVRGRPGVHVVTFDTSSSTFLGTAAKAASKALKKAGFTDVERGEVFKVLGNAGPLAEGELDRASEWGRALSVRP
ncbi:hypothetical protein GCM10009785_07990 [Brooklawnia cerclae]|uniref:Flavodoxin n=1 Tax=Brooklawnia cerclae TaxID=349934 RepID=A0ABX0SNM9_9ACTN|nr:flavodoxin domain-containing protein [Brooklawnia cerclae]NIH58376.1 flavodoxin [Brooklawnia cerclae]